MLQKKVKDPVVGWKEMGGWDERQRLTSNEEAQSLVDRATMLESYIGDKYYGDWYHNTALIVVSAFAAWVVGRFGLGIAWVSIVLMFAGTAYRTSIRRLRRNFRDDMVRQLALKAIESDVETMEWLNSFVHKFWQIYEPTLSSQVITIGNQVLADATPGFIESLTIDEFTLGTKAPRIEHVRTFTKTQDDVSVMDWKFSFTPNDTEDMTARQLKSKVNPRIVLGIRIGKGVVSKSLPVLVEDMSFAGEMRVRIKMIATFPHVQTVDVSFLEPPAFDFVLKPIGGDTFGFDINIIPGLSKFIKEMVDANIGPMLYAPNAFQLNIEQMLAGSGLDSAVGVLSVKVRRAKDLINSQAKPYVKFSFQDKVEVARTSIKDKTPSPVWNETKHLLVRNLNDVLAMEVVDFNDFRNDKSLGIVNFTLKDLRDQPTIEGIAAKVLSGGKAKGQILYDVAYSPVLEGKTLDDGTVEPPPESKSGIVHLTVEQARDLDPKQSMTGQVSSYVEVLLNGRKVFTTKTVKSNNNPRFDGTKELIVTNKTNAKFTIVVRDARGKKTEDPILGKYSASLTSLVAQTDKDKTWYGLTPEGEVQLRTTFKPVSLPDVSGSGYVEPIGVLRVHIKDAESLRNLEHVGKVDPYIRVLSGGQQRGRTIAFEDTLEANWDSVIFVPVQNESQDLVIECMDVEKLAKDRSLGTLSIDTSKYIKGDGSGGYQPYDSDATETGTFVMKGRSPKGKLRYNIQFYPATQVLDPDEAAEYRQRKQEKEREEAQLSEDQKKALAEEKARADGAVVDTNKTDGGADGGAVDMPLEEQLKFRSGVLAYSIDDVVGASDMFVRVLIDQGSFPSYVSPRIRGNKLRLHETGDAMVREIEHSQFTLQLASKAQSADDVVAEVTVPTMKVLEKCYYEKAPLTVSGNGVKAQVYLRARYFPVHMELNPVDSINNSGTMRIDVLDAADIKAADRGNRSDPFAVFRYDGEKLYKTETQKRTLKPVWNEYFEFKVPRRIGHALVCDLYDWDMGPGQDDYLGQAQVDLTQVDPNEEAVLVTPFDTKGTVRVKLRFTPGYVRVAPKASENALTQVTGSIGQAGKMITDLGGAPVKMVGSAGGAVGGAAIGAVGAVGGGVGHAVGGVGSKAGGLVKGVFGRGKKHDDSGNDSNANASNVQAQSTPDTSFADNSSLAPPDATSSPVSSRHNRSASVHSTSSAATSPSKGMGKVTIAAIRGFEGSQLQIRVYTGGKREKEVHKSKTIKAEGNETKIDETFTFKTTQDAILTFRVREHKSLGRDHELAHGTIPLAGAGQQAIPLGDGLGELHVMADYTS